MPTETKQPAADETTSAKMKIKTAFAAYLKKPSPENWKAVETQRDAYIAERKAEILKRAGF